MPCTTGMESYQPDYAARQENERLTRISCDIMRTLEAAGIDMSGVSPETRQWWEHHKAADERREIAERAIQERERLRQEGLAKLTPEQRRALGL